MNATIQTAIDQAARGEISYPMLAKTLREAGLRSYRVDVASHTAVYQGEGETFTVNGRAVAGPGEPPTVFDAAGLVAALVANQHREIDYDGFLERIWRSGVATYDVDLEGRTVTYRGQGGEAHVEQIPDV